MKEILIFAGTTEGRKLSETLCASGVLHTVCVATEYGEIVLNHHPLAKIHCGRMSAEEMQTFVKAGNYTVVVDATHPYAKVVTENIKSALQGMKATYIRLLREQEEAVNETEVTFFDTNEACAEALKKVEGNILLTTGSKELQKYCVCENVKRRLYVRVLPGIESILLCYDAGITGKQVIALQGPFSEEMNLALIHQYNIKCLVTKKSGISGGYLEKLHAAETAGIPTFVIANDLEDTGDSYEGVCEKIEKLCDVQLQKGGHMEVILAGIGMGNPENLTGEVKHAIENADVLLGAERMIEPYSPKIEKRSYYLANQILPYLKELQERNCFMEDYRVVVLFSGDSGFYSGCSKLYQSIKKEIDCGNLKAKVRIAPGISSVSYLAAKMGENYQDAEIYSIHGKEIKNLEKKISASKKMFLLMSGVKDVNRLGRILIDAGLEECQITTGRQLSYADESIERLTPEECVMKKEEGLYTCFVYNPNAISRKAAHGKADSEFIRDKVPMTKEEVREVSICKLHLCKDSVVYDIGSGTGSVAMEMAELSDDIKVYAIEQKEEAIALIEQNRAKFGLQNLEIIKAKAPEGLEKLPVASHAFIGGSSGQLKEILKTLYAINPEMRIVMNAVSLETICEIKECVGLFTIKNEEIVQLQVSRTRKAGNYHLMNAENPVWICAFDFMK